MWLQARAHKVRFSRSSGTLRRPIASIPIRVRRCPHPQEIAPWRIFLSMVFEFKGQFAECSSMGLGHLREAQMLRLGDENAVFGGPTKRLKKLGETSRAPAEIRENLVAARTLDIFGQPNLSLACVKSGLKFPGILCPLQRLQF